MLSGGECELFISHWERIEGNDAMTGNVVNDFVSVFVPVLTPSYIKDELCCAQLKYFVEERKRRLAGAEVLPIHYHGYGTFIDLLSSNGGEFLPLLREARVRDWRSLRLGGHDAPETRAELANFAVEIMSALKQASHPDAAHHAYGVERGVPSHLEPWITPATGEIQRAYDPSKHYPAVAPVDERSSKALVPSPAPLPALPSVHVDSGHDDKPRFVGGPDHHELSFMDRYIKRFISGDEEPLESARSAPEGQVLVVDGSGRKGEFRTIGAAIANVQEGGTILLYPGTYREHLRINKSVSILGQGTCTNTVVEFSREPVVEVRRSKSFGRVKNNIVIDRVTLKQVGRSSDDWPAVIIIGGVLVLKNCQVISESNDALINEYGGVLVASRCTIKGKSGTGVIFRDRSTGLLERCHVVDCGKYGVEIKKGSNPTIHTSVIARNKRTGIFIQNDATGVFEGNQVGCNGQNGISVFGRARPTVRNNRIAQNEGYGVEVQLHSGGVYEDNFVGHNAKGPFQIGEDCRPLLTWRNNRRK